MNADLFADRRGRIWQPKSDSIVRSREGVFSCCKCQDKILFIWPEYATDIPELAGGGIDEGEELDNANQREFLEETGFHISYSAADSLKTHHQVVRFYAEDVNEFWIYTQTFFLFDGTDELLFQGYRKTPENGLMRWVAVADVKELPLHVMHRMALEAFGIL